MKNKMKRERDVPQGCWKIVPSRKIEGKIERRKMQ